MLHDPHQPQPARTPDLVAILARATIFGDSTAEQLARLAHHTRLVRLEAGEILFQHGDKARALYLLLEGQVKLYRASVDGNEVIFDLLDPGTTIAETSLLQPQPRFPCSCAALVDVEVAAVDLPAVAALLHDSINTCLGLLHRVSECADRRLDDIERLALQSATCRVAGYLLAQLPPGRDEVVLRVTKGVMASRLGIRAETLSRILKQLSDNGAVSIYGKLVRVPSRQKLQRLARESVPYPHP
jgi:CRP-like cAMP-binding protein